MKKTNKDIVKYIALLILPLFIIAPLYFFISTALEEDLEKSNDTLLSTLRIGMDAYIQEVESILCELSMDGDILNVKDSLKFNDTDVANVKSKLSSICAENFYISDAYIVFGSRDYIISQDGMSDIKEYLQEKKGLSSEEYFDYRKTLGRVYKNEFLKKSENGILVAICSILSHDIGILQAQIVVEMDISEIVKSINIAKSYNVFLKDKDMMTVYSNGNEELNEIIPSVVKNGVYGKYYISYSRADFNDLSYFLAVELKDQRAPLIYIKWSIIGIYFIFIIFITFLKKRFFDLQQNRIIKLFDLFEKDYSGEKSFDELYSKINNIILEKEKLDNEIVKKVYVQSLLKDKLSNKRKFKSYLNTQKEHVVISIMTDDYQQLYPDSSLTELEKFEESQVIAENVLTEYLSKDFVVLSAEVDDSIVFIVESENISERNIDNIILNASEKIKTYFKFSLRYGIGRVEGEDFAQAYQIANNSIMSIEDCFTENGLYFYPLETEERITTNIKVGNYSNAKEELKTIIDVNFQTVHLDFNKNLFYTCIINTIVRVIWDLGLIQYEKLYRRLSEILNFRDKKMFFDAISLLIDEIENCLRHESDIDSGFRKKIGEYIEKNYNDKNISLYVLANYMHMNPSYFSRKFKQQYDMGVLEYIYKTRIEAAKVELANNKKVEETAKIVGFSTERSFVRAFVKHVGVTPAQYRKNITK